MTSEQQLHIRAELARRMGYSVIQSGTYFYLTDPHGAREENADGYAVGSTCEAGAWMDAPDPFTRAEDKDALVRWLAADDDRWLPFKKELRLEWVASTSPRAASLDYERWMLTLPCEVIVIAAARALGIPEASE